jgi:hypothetical protein
MKVTIYDVDAQRARWLRYRVAQRMTTEAGGAFALGGLGSHVGDDLDLRLLFLPDDPGGGRVPLTAETLEWLREERRTPYDGQPPRWGNLNRPTSSALVLYDEYEEDARWARYLALHRHGGLEIGLSRFAYTLTWTRVFPLRRTVGLAWTAAALQSEVAENHQLDPPFELSVALRRTKGAILGDFAEGWPEFGRGLWDPARCIEDDVLLRWEFQDEVDPEELALALGDRMEQTFGSTLRRHLAQSGEYEGRFDPRFAF